MKTIILALLLLLAACTVETTETETDAPPPDPVACDADCQAFAACYHAAPLEPLEVALCERLHREGAQAWQELIATCPSPEGCPAPACCESNPPGWCGTADEIVLRCEYGDHW